MSDLNNLIPGVIEKNLFDKKLFPGKLPLGNENTHLVFFLEN